MRHRRVRAICTTVSLRYLAFRRRPELSSPGVNTGKPKVDAFILQRIRKGGRAGASSVVPPSGWHVFAQWVCHFPRTNKKAVSGMKTGGS